MHGTPQIVLQGYGAAGAGLAGDSTGDKHAFTIPPGNWVLKEFGTTIASASTHATAAVISFEKRPTAGSDTGRTVLGTITKTLSVNQQGKHLWQRPTTRVQLKGGEQVVVEVTTANGDTLAFVPQLVLEESPETYANLTTHVEKTA